jgi:ureidoacrylate peracid hydrolase
MVEFAVVPDRMALLSIDLQNCFVEGSAPRGLEVLGRVNRLAVSCREAGIPVFHVRHALARGEDPGLLGEMFPGVEEMLDRESETAALHPALVVDERDVLLEKPHFGAFHGTDLAEQLRARGIDTVVVAGIETNVCCETTAREAMVRDFRVFFLSDGTTTGGVPGLSVDEVQSASLATVGRFFAQLSTVEEMIERIGAAAAAR